MTAGEVFLLKKVDSHIYFIVHRFKKKSSKGSKTSNGIVLLNFTTYEENKDCACIITPEEYPCLDHKSVIAYRYGEIVMDDAITRLERNIRHFFNPLGKSLLKIIQQGALSSRYTPNKIKDILRPII